jgi:hypothetical protein
VTVELLGGTFALVTHLRVIDADEAARGSALPDLAAAFGRLFYIVADDFVEHPAQTAHFWIVPLFERQFQRRLAVIDQSLHLSVASGDIAPVNLGLAIPDCLISVKWFSWNGLVIRQAQIWSRTLEFARIWPCKLPSRAALYGVILSRHSGLAILVDIGFEQALNLRRAPAAFSW